MLPLRARDGTRNGLSSSQVILWTISLLSLKSWAIPTPIPAMLADLGTEAARGSKVGSLSKSALNDASLGRISTKIENGFKPSDQGAHIREIRYTADVPKEHLQKASEIVGEGHLNAIKSLYRPKPESNKFSATSDIAHNADDSKASNPASTSDSEEVFFDATDNPLAETKPLEQSLEGSAAVKVPTRPDEKVIPEGRSPGDSDSEDVFYDATDNPLAEAKPLEQSHDGKVAVKVSTRPYGKLIPEGRSPEGYTRNGIRVTIDGGQFQEDGILSAKSIAAMERKLAAQIGGPKMINLFSKLKNLSKKIINLLRLSKPKSTKVSPIDETPKVDPSSQSVTKADEVEDLKEPNVPELNSNPKKNNLDINPETMTKLEQDAASAAAIEKLSLPQSHFLTELSIDTSKVKDQNRGRVLRQSIRKHVPQREIKQMLKVLKNPPAVN